MEFNFISNLNINAMLYPVLLYGCFNKEKMFKSFKSIMYCHFLHFSYLAVSGILEVEIISL